MKTIKNINLLLIGSIAFLASCSSAYRTGQTPDDVYYSPAPAQTDRYIASDNNNGYVDDDGNYVADNGDRGTYFSADDEERDIRRGINDRRYRSSINVNLGFGYGSGYGYFNPFNTPFRYSHLGFGPYSSFTPYYSFGYGYFPPFYDPFYSPFYSSWSPYYSYYPWYGGGYYVGKGNYYIDNGRNNINTGARRYNTGGYVVDKPAGTRPIGNRTIGNRTNSENRTATPIRRFDRNTNVPERRNVTPQRSTRSGSSAGNGVRRVFTPATRSTPRNAQPAQREIRRTEPLRQSTPQRNFTPPSTPTRESSNSSAPVRTFRRG